LRGGSGEKEKDEEEQVGGEEVEVDKVEVGEGRGGEVTGRMPVLRGARIGNFFG